MAKKNKHPDPTVSQWYTWNTWVHKHPKCYRRLWKGPHTLRVCRWPFLSSPLWVLSCLCASQESGWRADVEAPRSSANSLLMHHLCPSGPRGPGPLGSIAALKLCLVGWAETKLCCYSNWTETGAKCCSKCYSAFSHLTVLGSVVPALASKLDSANTLAL